MIQKWFFLFADVRNIIPSRDCSMMHTGFLFIRFENLFFALDEIGLI